MPGLIFNNGITELNTLLSAAMVAAGFQVGLYTNNHVPAFGDTVMDYSEATYGGYARQSMVSPTPGGVTGNIDLETFAPVTFTPSGGGLPETVYGYFVVNGLSTFIGAELFAVPIVVSAPDIVIIVLPSLTYQDRSVA